MEHPTTTDGNVTWKHYCILRFQKVTASTNSSEDDDMAATNYTVKFQNIDPKKSFRFKITPHDALCRNIFKCGYGYFRNYT